MKKHKYSKWTLSFGAIGGFIGIVLSSINNFNLFALLGGACGALLILIINIVYVKRKANNTPEFDERIIKNIQKFYFYSTNIFFAVFFIVLGLLSIFDVEFVSVSILLIIFFSYFVISGIITIFISRK